jgi:hypothetical protein
MFTFVIGTGSVLVAPTDQSLVPELVPGDQVPAAAQLKAHAGGHVAGLDRFQAAYSKVGRHQSASSHGIRLHPDRHEVA